MSDTRVSVQRLCPQCGAMLNQGAPRCFICGIFAGPPSASSLEPLPDLPNLQRGSPLSLLIAIVVLGLLFVGTLAAEAYGLAGFLLIAGLVLVPILARSWIGSRHRPGQPAPVPSPKGVLAIFGIIVACGVAGFVAFFVTCWGGFFAGTAVGLAAGARGYEPLTWGGVFAFILGPVCGVIVAVWLGRRLYRW